MFLFSDYVPAFYIAFIGSSCDPENDPCVFQNWAEAMLGVFTMSVGDFEDVAATFSTSRYPAMVSVS